MVNGFAAIGRAPGRSTRRSPRRDLSSIRRGNLWPIMPADVRAADPELRHNMLGMTEAGSVCLVSDDETRPTRAPARVRSAGRCPASRRRSSTPATATATPTVPNPGDAIGEVGELWFRGPFLMEGYYGRERHETFTPTAGTAPAICSTSTPTASSTSTAGSGDMIKTAGANVSPREVEAAILEVTGPRRARVGVDDADRGQLVAAAIRVPPGQPGLDADALRTALRARLSAYKVPQRFLVLADAEVPMLSSGKLDARALKELFGA